MLWGRELGCSPRTACLIGLAYGLATPAYVYATLAYGHQATAFALFASFFLLWKKKRPRDSFRLFLAGFLAAYAAVIEIQVGPVSAILGFYLLAQCLRGQRRPDALALFAVGAIFPTLILLDLQPARLRLALGHGLFSSRDEVVRRGAQRRQSPRLAHSPTTSGKGSSPSSGDRYRGLTFYAPILWLTIPGWVVLIVPPVLGSGGRDVFRGRCGHARELVLP